MNFQTQIMASLMVYIQYLLGGRRRLKVEDHERADLLGRASRLLRGMKEWDFVEGNDHDTFVCYFACACGVEYHLMRRCMPAKIGNLYRLIFLVASFERQEQFVSSAFQCCKVCNQPATRNFEAVLAVFKHLQGVRSEERVA